MIRALLASVALSLLAGQAAAQDAQDFATIARGRYMAVAADCAACHTARGGTPFAGGLALQTPFGTLLSPNITPDPATGIGAWSGEAFVAAVQQGIGHGGEHLYPAMPYTYYNGLSRDDVLAIRAYLMTLPAVSHDVQANQLPFPFNIRASMGVWNALNFHPEKFHQDPGKSATWNRGAYLVVAAEHCGMCHTPKNLLGGDERKSVLQGAALAGWFAPNLTGQPHQGLGDWSLEDIVQYLKTGSNRFAIAGGPMAEAVAESTSHLTDADLTAMATYLKDLPAEGRVPAAISPADPAMRRGAALYVDQCAACHTRAGTGVVGLFPRLAGGANIQQPDATNAIRVVLAGARAGSTAAAPTAPAMPGFGWKLSDAEVADVVTYIRNNWGNAAPPVGAGAVASLRGSLQAQR